MDSRRRAVPAALLAASVVAGELVTAAATYRSPLVLTGYAVAVGATVLVSLRRPAGAFVAALFVAAIGGLGFVLLLGTAFRAGRETSSRLATAVVTGAAISALGLPVAVAVADPSAWSEGLTTYLVFVLLPLLAGRYLRQHARLVDALTGRNEELGRARDLVAERERLHERLRIAREMHDALGHRLGLVSVQAAALEVEDLPPRQREAIIRLAGSTRDAVAGLHEVVGALRQGDEIDGPGLSRLDELVDGYRCAGVQVTVERSGQPRSLGAEADRAAYRAVEEGLTNAVKHAPGRPIAVAFVWEADALLLAIVNQAADGPAGLPGSVGPIGSVGHAGGHGYLGLRERIESLGGFAVLRRDGDEIRLSVLLPVERNETLPVVASGRGRAVAVGVVTGVLLFGVLPAAMLLGVG